MNAQALHEKSTGLVFMHQEDPVRSRSDLPDEVISARLITLEDGELPLEKALQKLYAVLRDGERDFLLVSSTEEPRLTIRMQKILAKIRAQSDRVLTIYYVLPSVIDEVYTKSAGGTGDDNGRANTKVENLIAEMVAAAAEAKASDIHIENYIRKAVILFRVHGTRRVWKNITASEARSLGQVMYAVYADSGSKDITWNPSETSDAAFEWALRSGASFQLRFSSSPIHPSPGFHIVLRLISLASDGKPIETCGYTEAHLDDFDMVTSSSSGLFLFCGATNSGKSTSLQGLIRDISKRRGIGIKIITVEDPVEAVIPDACQVPVPRKKDEAESKASFNKALRGTLRQDPDVVVVGEIRDEVSATVCKDLVLAGRKLLSTVHANSAQLAYTRLDQIGLPMEILCSPRFISGICYQRLVRTVCQKCALRWNQESIEALNLKSAFISRVEKTAKDLEKIRLVNPLGCPACKHTGVSGMTVCAEILVPDDDYAELMLAGRHVEAKKHALSRGFKPILQHALEKMNEGILSPIDIEPNIDLLTAGDN